MKSANTLWADLEVATLDLYQASMSLDVKILREKLDKVNEIAKNLERIAKGSKSAKNDTNN